MSEKAFAQKQVIIDEISSKIQNSSSVVVAEYRGLTVAEMTELRNELRQDGVELKVYKNNLVKRATAQLEQTGLDEYLTGPNALIFGTTDAVAPARIAAKFAKKHEALVLKAGIVEGNLLGTEDVLAISKLPNREGLYSQLLCCLKEPVSKVARAIKAVADAKEAGNAPVENSESEAVTEAA